uniref:c-type cytochrome c biogenesis protein ccs1 n=1 Tax=Nemalion vermiculare TaxID=935621 RepID=UPI002580E827|nr:c-type cytochrome c biogenesis protein ccs1 [Nemalion vermiculare]WGV34329.1 c-type cytochrome c biogenesis protein ccs1 [Nemalion vermiculare]
MLYRIFHWKVFKFLGNLTFSIFLLLTISTLSIVGTIIEQNQTLDYYKLKYPANTEQWNLNWVLIKNCQLDQLYTSWFFLLLMLVFAVSLIVCTFSTQLPSLKNARRWKIKKQLGQENRLGKTHINQYSTYSFSLYNLNKIGYHAFYQAGTIYGYKGIYGRLAPVFVHLSLILLLAGSVISLFSSFYIQELIPEGESFNLQNTTNAGQLSKVPSYITGRIEKFSIEYYSDLSVKQFYSSVQLYNHQSKKSNEKTISVNRPMKFEGLTIYQTDWEIYGLKIKIGNNKAVQIPTTKIASGNNRYWVASIPYANDNYLSFVLSNIEGNVGCYDQKGELIQDIRVGQFYSINHIPVEINSILTSTGLQIKQDPGVNLIYSSFVLLMLSSTISYMSFSQIWILQNTNCISISGFTNRAQIGFEEDLWTIKRIVVNNQ